MDFPSPRAILEIIDQWMGWKKDDGADFSNCRLYVYRLNLSLKTAAEQKELCYWGIEKPSPIKVAACVGYGLATGQPLVWASPNAPASPKGSLEDDRIKVRRMTAIENAFLGLDAARYLVGTAQFDCNVGVKPPFLLRYPSKHFRQELARSLACGELTVPGLAYVLELLLFSSSGTKLFGSLDGKNNH